MITTPQSIPNQLTIASSPEQMRAFFFSQLPAIRQAAYEFGYTIAEIDRDAVDMHLIAVPQIHVATEDIDALAAALAKAASGFCREGGYEWVVKSHTRKITQFPLCWVDWEPSDNNAGYVQVSVLNLWRVSW